VVRNPANRAPQGARLKPISLDLLDRMIAMSAVRALIAYALYTVDARTVAVQRTEKLVLTVPFVLYGLYRLLWVFYRGGGGPTLQPNCCTTPSFRARRSGCSAAPGGSSHKRRRTRIGVRAPF